MIITDVVCPFCGCLCDDLVIEVEDNEIKTVRNACKLGASKFLKHKENRRKKPIIRENGNEREVDFDEAIDYAVKILKNSTRCLIYGLSNTSNEAIEYAVKIAEILRGYIDNTSTVCHGPSVVAYQTVGYPSCTLGDIKNRADLIIYWGCNPLNAHPRHLSRYTLYPRGLFTERGFLDRKLIVIDVRETDTARIATKFLRIEPNKDYELISAMRAILNGLNLEQDKIAGIDVNEIYEVVDMMKSCKFGILFFGMGLTQTYGRDRTIDNAISLVIDLNKYTKFSIMMMRGHYNVTGSNQVLAWLTGFPYAVDFTRGYPRYNPGETGAVDVLANGEVDSAIIVAADPVANFPKEAVRHLLSIPYINIDPFYNLSAKYSRVYIPTKIVGIEIEGTAYRMDNIPIRLRKVVENTDLPSDEDVLKAIYERLIEDEIAIKERYSL